MRVIAFLIGLVLLLPGACAFVFLLGGVTALPELGSGEWRDPNVWGLIGIAASGWGVCFLISFGAIIVMRNALRSPPQPSPSPPPDLPEA